jgi:hypothetical protein
MGWAYYNRHMVIVRLYPGVKISARHIKRPHRSAHRKQYMRNAKGILKLVPVAGLEPARLFKVPGF